MSGKNHKIAAYSLAGKSYSTVAATSWSIGCTLVVVLVIRDDRSFFAEADGPREEAGRLILQPVERTLMEPSAVVPLSAERDEAAARAASTES